MKFPVKKKGLRGVPCFRPVLRDTRISDGALRLLLVLKSLAKHGRCTVSRYQLGVMMRKGVKAIGILLNQLLLLRLINIIHNSAGGNQIENTYEICDEHFARHLARKAPPKPKGAPRGRVKNNPRVPTVLSNIPVGTLRLEEAPPNVIPYRQQSA